MKAVQVHRFYTIVYMSTCANANMYKLLTSCDILTPTNCDMSKVRTRSLDLCSFVSESFATAFCLLASF